MLYCYTGVPITHFNGSWHSLYPGWLVERIPPGPISVTYQAYRSLLHFCAENPTCNSVYVKRTFALGDILMLLPVLRAFRRELSRPVDLILGVQGRFVADFAPVGQMLGFRVIKDWTPGPPRPRADIHIDLDGALEADHRGGEESNLHRVYLYERLIFGDEHGKDGREHGAGGLHR